MKKTLRFAILLMAILVGTAGAEAKIFRLGVKAGLNLSDMSLTKLNNIKGQIMDVDNQCGWNAGLTAEVQVPIIGICADVSVLYSRLNQKVVNNDPTQNLPSNFGKDFLDIPIHLKYKIGLPVVGKYVAPLLYTGPSFAVNLNKKTFDDIRNRKCQTSWDFGLGVELFSHLQITGQYCLGMNNLAKYWGEVQTEQVKVKNNY